MTSQLVIMNQLAIAVATDTLTSRQSAGDTKTSPSASKVYELPSPATGVVLHSGSVHIGRTSWRLLVREWSRSSSPLTAPTMSDYRDAFAAWTNQHASGMGLEDVYGVIDRLGAIKSEGGHIGWLSVELGADVRNALIADAKAADADTAKAIHEVIKRVYSTEAFPDLSEENAKALIAETQLDLGVTFQTAYSLLADFKLGPKTLHALEDFAVAALRCIPAWERSSIDLHFVGFGAQEALGQVAKLGIYGYWGGRLRSTTMNLGAQAPYEYPYFYPIAQSRAIDAFWTGSSGDFDHAVSAAARNAILAIEGVTPENADKAVGAMNEQITNFSQEKFRNPLFQTIGSLAISNLGKLADFLIHLQAFRSATDEGEATVGGFVESLVITPEHGVRWRHRLSTDVRGIEDSSHAFD
jgi:hypothetical protein